MREKNVGIEWDLCKCGREFIRIDSRTCLECHRREDE